MSALAIRASIIRDSREKRNRVARTTINNAKRMNTAREAVEACIGRIKCLPLGNSGA